MVAGLLGIDNERSRGLRFSQVVGLQVRITTFEPKCCFASWLYLKRWGSRDTFKLHDQTRTKPAAAAIRCQMMQPRWGCEEEYVYVLHMWDRNCEPTCRGFMG